MHVNSHQPIDLPSADPGLQVTPEALDHIRRVLPKAGGAKATGLRVGVKKAGCSGYEYVLAVASPETIKPIDYVFEFDDIQVIIEKETYLKFMKGGTIMEFHKEAMKEGLHFNNPNVGHQCGCGESFTLNDEDL
jgi:iron-sulfur cluster assembly accessory protein